MSDIFPSVTLFPVMSKWTLISTSTPAARSGKSYTDQSGRLFLNSTSSGKLSRTGAIVRPIWLSAVSLMTSAILVFDSRYAEFNFEYDSKVSKPGFNPILLHEIVVVMDLRDSLESL